MTRENSSYMPSNERSSAESLKGLRASANDPIDPEFINADFGDAQKDHVKPNPWAYQSHDEAPKSKGTDKRNLLGTGNYVFPELHEREMKRMTVYGRASMMQGRNSTMNSGRASSRSLK